MIGPQVFSRMINTESYEQVFLALTLGAVMMILGGLAELIFGVKAERESLESIAKPLTVEDSPGTPLSPAPAGWVKSSRGPDAPRATEAEVDVPVSACAHRRDRACAVPEQGRMRPCRPCRMRHGHLTMVVCRSANRGRISLA